MKTGENTGKNALKRKNKKLTPFFLPSHSFMFSAFKVVDRLDNSSDIDLELEFVPPPFDDITVYHQGNIQASRKKVMPVLKSFLHGDKTPDVASKDFVTQASVTTATEGFTSMSEMMDSHVEDKNVVFNLSSVEGEQSIDGNSTQLLSPGMDISENFSNFNNSNFVTMETGHVKAAKGFDPFSTVTSQSSAENGTSPQNEPTGKASSGPPFLSSANSSNLLDFAISDSELVDPFSSVEEPFQSNVTQMTPKDTHLDNSERIEPKVEKTEEKSAINPFFDVTSSEGKKDENEPKGETLGENMETRDINPFFDIGTSAQTEVSISNASANFNPFSEELLDFSAPPDSGQLENDSDRKPTKKDSQGNAVDVLLDFTDSTQVGEEKILAPSYTGRLFELSISGESAKNGVQNSDNVSSTNPFEPGPDNLQNLFSDLREDKDVDNLMNTVKTSEQTNFLDTDSLIVSTPPLNEKSISLIVECDPLSQADNLAELDESEFFDKVPTPDIQHSGESSPFVNSGVSTPFELEPGRSIRTSSDSSVGFSVPPNSLMDRGFEVEQKDHDLPSFNSAEMVERIHRKKASLGNAVDFVDAEHLTEGDTVVSAIPYTPQNSFREDVESYVKDRSLPSLNNSAIIEKVQKKRDSLGTSLGFQATESLVDRISDNNENQSTNPFSDFDNELGNAQIGENSTQSNPFLNIDDEKDADKLDSMEHVPFTPVNTFVDTSPELFMKSRNSLTDPELMHKLNELKLEKDAKGETGTNPFDFNDENGVKFIDQGTSQQNQSGSADLLDIFGTNQLANQNQSESGTNPFLDINEAGNQPDNLLEEMEKAAQQEAADSVANKVTREVIDVAMATFPDVTNQALAVEIATEILQTENPDWMKQGSGDSGIGSTDSPQRGKNTIR